MTVGNNCLVNMKLALMWMISKEPGCFSRCVMVPTRPMLFPPLTITLIHRICAGLSRMHANLHQHRHDKEITAHAGVSVMCSTRALLLAVYVVAHVHARFACNRMLARASSKPSTRAFAAEAPVNPRKPLKPKP